MARVKMNRDDPRRGASPFYNLIRGGDLMVETPNDCTYADSNEHLFGPLFGPVLEQDSSGQIRGQGARSGLGKKKGVKGSE